MFKFVIIVILASEFDILQRKITITVPWVQNGSDYQLVCEFFRCSDMRHYLLIVIFLVFGDSGNFSPTFTIKGSHGIF